jgi:hypothetical protein
MADSFTLKANLKLSADVGSFKRVEERLSRLRMPDITPGPGWAASVTAAKDMGVAVGSVGTSTRSAKAAVGSFATAAVPQLDKVTAAANRTAARVRPDGRRRHGRRKGRRPPPGPPTPPSPPPRGVGATRLRRGATL